MTLRGFCELVRIFLTPSAVADSLAGFALACTALPRATAADWELAMAGGASVLLYWTGMATNDLFDLHKDRRAGARKPLVDGRVSIRAAVFASIAMALGALALAAPIGAIAPASAVIVALLLYNAGLKRVPIVGSVTMGACRAGNFLVGAGAVVDSVAGLHAFLLPAAILGIYTTGVTAVSVLEDRTHRPAIFHALATLMLAIPLGLGVLEPTSSPGWINTIALLWILIATQRRAASRRSPSHPAAVYVRGALAGIFFVDAGILWAFAPTRFAWPAPASLYALWLLSIIWKRRWLGAGRADS